MKISKKATSIVEAMIIILIVTVGIVGMYKIYNNGIRLSKSVNNKIQAIGIAKEGIEAFTNIRDTNWLIFSADYENCWNTYNYNTDCIDNSGSTTDIPDNGHFKIYKDTDNRWKMGTGTVTDSNFSNPTYRTEYKIGIDSNGLYTGSGGTETKPIFTREILTTYSGTGKINITSLVQWVDSSSNGIHKIELKSVLSNWKD